MQGEQGRLQPPLDGPLLFSLLLEPLCKVVAQRVGVLDLAMRCLRVAALLLVLASSVDADDQTGRDCDGSQNNAYCLENGGYDNDCCGNPSTTACGGGTYRKVGASCGGNGAETTCCYSCSKYTYDSAMYTCANAGSNFGACCAGYVGKGISYSPENVHRQVCNASVVWSKHVVMGVRNGPGRGW